MRILSAIFFSLLAAAPAFADDPVVPEIDATSGMGAIALVVGVLTLLRESRRK